MTDTDSILLTDDGYPVGEVVVNPMGSVLPSPPSEDVASENRAELTRVAASELTGEPDPDVAVAELYPGYADTEKRDKALHLYIVEQKSFAEVAEECGVPERTVSRWAWDGKWVEHAEEDMAVRQRASRLELARIRAERRAKAVEEQLSAAKKIRGTALDQLDEGEVSVKSAAEAVKSAADVEARILGIAENGALDQTSSKEQDGEKAAGKTPLVMVFQGGLPPVRKST